MAERVTIQDIADALGLSRNTVSKAINNSGIIADSTREAILRKAAEMGYKQFSYLDISSLHASETGGADGVAKGSFALFSTGIIGSSHFSHVMTDVFQQEVTKRGYGFTMYRILPEECSALTLPVSFDRETCAGILCVELHDMAYARMLCDLKIPILFVDTPSVCKYGKLPADVLSMDNETDIYAFVHEMVRRGKKRIGFIGDYLHCQSFTERFMALRNAMFYHNLPLHDRDCIIGDDVLRGNMDYENYIRYLSDTLPGQGDLADVYLCANDFVALDVLRVFKDKNVSVPDHVWLCGFDDAPEARLVTPPLTSIHIHAEILGHSAVTLLMSRIKDPTLNHRTMYAQTHIVYRASTGD